MADSHGRPRPFGSAGFAIKYGVAATGIPKPTSPLFSQEEADKLRAALEAQGHPAPKTLEEAAQALADAVRHQSTAAHRHRDALAQVEEAHRIALARVEELAQAHIKAREVTAAARALVEELGKKEP
jgi:acyl-CoA synthetase (NDP forming)